MNTKYKVLSLLNKNKDQALSGQKIADKLGISRTAVWKAVESLRNDGHLIESQGNKGYILEKINSDLNEENLRLCLGENFNEADIDIYQSSISTNTLCKEIMERGAEKAVVASKKQENGKARNGKKFFSPEGGLYFSFAYRPISQNFNNSLLTIAIAVAVVKTLKDLYEINLEIKWVNDLKIKDKKVGGILTEGSISIENMVLDYIICGIGLNLIEPKERYPEDLSAIAGPIFDKLPATFNPNQVIAEIIENFFIYKESEELLPLYKESCQTLGKSLTFIQDNKEYEGTAKDITDQGRLVLELANGEEVEITGGY